MIRWRDLLLAAYAPLALRHTLVEGRVPHEMRMFAKTHRTTCTVSPHASARVVRLFAVQIR